MNEGVQRCNRNNQDLENDPVDWVHVGDNWPTPGLEDPELKVPFTPLPAP